MPEIAIDLSTLKSLWLTILGKVKKLLRTMRTILVLTGMFMLLACTSKQVETQAVSVPRVVSHANKITLSYVRAYLQIGNIKKAREQFQKVDQAELNPSAMLALAELRAAEGDIVGAQQAFLFSFSDNQAKTPFNHAQVSPELIDFFCREKKWPALEGYAGALIKDIAVIDASNSPYSTIGICSFHAQRWRKAKYWLEKLDFSKAVDPFTYLALARISIEQKKYSAAKGWMIKFEAAKTTIDAKILWSAFEVYRALQKTDIALRIAENLRSLFPNSPHTQKLDSLMSSTQATSPARQRRAVTGTVTTSVQKRPTLVFHSIKSGETLYQLSKQYELSMADLLLWNPNLVIENIALGTRIRISPSD